MNYPTAVAEAAAPAEAASLASSKDNTLYESVAGSISNGAGQHFFVGTTGTGSIRRGVIAFDIGGGVPAGSTINSVTLTLRMSRTTSGAHSVALHRLLSDWGEGASDASGNEGAGIGASIGDATWIHRFFNATTWSTAGGDFSAATSASSLVGGSGSYTFSSAQMASDVQNWLDSPSTNFGWLLKGDESRSTTSKRFDSKENFSPSNRPVLNIQFTSPSLSVADLTAQEDVGDAVLTISLDEAATVEVSVQVDTHDGTAIATDDYTAVDGRIVTVLAGTTSVTTTVPILDDTLTEPDEMFTFTLSNPTGAVIGDGSATVTIVDDDVPAPTPIPGVRGWGLIVLAALVAAALWQRGRPSLGWHTRYSRQRRPSQEVRGRGG